MRYILAALFAVFLALPTFAADDEYERLLSDLAASTNREDAHRLSGEIWQIWLTAPNPAAQEVLDAAMIRRRSHDILGAISHLNKLVTNFPDYAEGWNQRATMYFLIGAYERSLDDVAKVLEREPRHFGALSGKAVILYRQGKVGLAQLAVQEALKHHPFLNERAIIDAGGGTDL